MGHSANSCVAALEKGLAYQTMAINCERRLADLFMQIRQMTNSHSQGLKVAVH